MADNIIDLLTACFWDLRSQCESQVRTLSAAQRLLDDFRRGDGRADREAVVRNLRENVKDLATVHAAMEEVIGLAPPCSRDLTSTGSFRSISTDQVID